MKIFLALTLLVSPAAFAKTSVYFTEARLYAPLKGTPATAAYVTVANTSGQPVRLQIVKAEFFNAVEIHETLEKDGRMSMVKKEFFEIPANGKLEMKPGGNHVMLFTPKKELKDGDMVQLTFRANDELVTEKFKVVPRVPPPTGAAPAAHH